MYLNRTLPVCMAVGGGEVVCFRVRSALCYRGEGSEANERYALLQGPLT